MPLPPTAYGRPLSTFAACCTPSTGAAERTLLRTLVNALDDGFVLAAEFRTVKDRSADRTCGSHNRRLIDHHRFAKQLRDEYGFHIEAFEAGEACRPRTVRTRTSPAWWPGCRPGRSKPSLIAPLLADWT